MAADLLSAESGLIALRAISEPTRLRILMLLSSGELTVKDLTLILRQSQPRISRHLKLMHDARLITRVQEGSWVYVRLCDQATRKTLIEALLTQFDASDQTFRRDRERADEIRRARVERAQAFFAAHADEWDRVRAMHADEALVEERLLAMLASGENDLLVDMGTGTGRILELLASRYRRAIGIDSSAEMLAYARARTQGAEFAHVQVRQGDICDLALADASADAVVMHQVLHYLEAPDRAIVEAARILRTGGQLVIVDFATHDAEQLRTEFAHRRLGLADEQMRIWLDAAGLKLQSYDVLPPDNTASATKSHGLTVSFWLAAALEDNQASGGRAQRTLEMVE